MEQNSSTMDIYGSAKLCLHDFANEYVRELSADS